MLPTIGVAMILIAGGSEGNAAENFGEAGCANDGELLVGGRGGVAVAQGVGDGDEAVGVCALVSATADRGGDAVDGDLAIAVEGAGDVADAIGCRRPGKFGHGVIARGVVVDGVGDAEFEASLERVSAAPGFGGGVEDPLLDACGGLRGGVGIESGVGGDGMPLVGTEGGGTSGES